MAWLPSLCGQFGWALTSELPAVVKYVAIEFFGRHFHAFAEVGVEVAGVAERLHALAISGRSVASPGMGFLPRTCIAIHAATISGALLFCLDHTFCAGLIDRSGSEKCRQQGDGKYHAYFGHASSAFLWDVPQTTQSTASKPEDTS